MSIVRLDIHVLAASGNITSDERPNEFPHIALSRSAPPNDHFSWTRLSKYPAGSIARIHSLRRLS
jgi:hypothetical protein